MKIYLHHQIVLFPYLDLGVIATSAKLPHLVFTILQTLFERKEEIVIRERQIFPVFLGYESPKQLFSETGFIQNDQSFWIPNDPQKAFWFFCPVPLLEPLEEFLRSKGSTDISIYTEMPQDRVYLLSNVYGEDGEHRPTIELQPEDILDAVLN